MALANINSLEQREKNSQEKIAFLEDKVQQFQSIECPTNNFQTDFESCKQESERQTNETQILRNDIGKCRQGLNEANVEVERCQQGATELKTGLEKCQREAFNKCSFSQFEKGSLQATGNVVISLIRQVENAREIDACMGISNDLGYVTSKQCCEADQVMLFDMKTYEEIAIGMNSIWIEEHVCLINITEIEEMNFPTFDNEEVQACSILAFEESEGQFTEHQLNIDIRKCFDHPCSLKIGPNLFQNGTILNGTSVVCDEATKIGIITKSELNFQLIF